MLPLISLILLFLFILSHLQITFLNSVITPLYLTRSGISKNSRVFFQTTISNIFSRMKTFDFQTKFVWNMFFEVLFTRNQHWFRWWLGTWQVPSHYLNQCWPKCLTLYGFIKPQLTFGYPWYIHAVVEYSLKLDDIKSFLENQCNVFMACIWSGLFFHLVF